MTRARVLGVALGLASIDGEPWTRVKARKAATCILSRRKIKPGDLVYRPMGNGGNRMHRALASVVDAAIEPRSDVTGRPYHGDIDGDGWL